MNPPTRCHLWRNETLTTTEIYETLEKVETYDDDDHYSRRLMRCRDCGQLYFREFIEEIDWEGGNDPQYSTYIPVETEAEIAALRATDRFGLLAFSPRLLVDFPKEAKEPRVHWVGRPTTA
jgi:hypothetical protein